MQQQVSRGGRALRTGTDGCARASIAGGVRRSVRARPSVALRATAAPAPVEVAADKFISQNLAHFQTLPATNSPSLAQLRSSAWASLQTMSMPTTRMEEYRFTDITPLTRCALTAANHNVQVTLEGLQSLIPSDCAYSNVVVVNGVMRPELSILTSLTPGAYVGPLAQAPPRVAAMLGSQSSTRGGPFSTINSSCAEDVVVIALQEGCVMETPLYILYLSTHGCGATTPTTAPRLLIHAAEGSSLTLVEEHTCLDEASSSSLSMNTFSSVSSQESISSTTGSTDGTGSSTPMAPYFSCSVGEIFLEKGAKVTHGYACREHAGAIHFKGTMVEQASTSEYHMTEARLGGGLTRHDVSVHQGGAQTQTSMRHFILAGDHQLHDLHTKMTLDHPEGQVNQLHKCIAASPTSKAVFDGNVKVNRRAQRTDAGQLSRNLLLAKRATVNIKPNLQIVADDVKCTHGCAISDLSDEELFYFRARGITALAARQALVASFGAEVTQHLGLRALLERVQGDVRRTLRGIDLKH